MHLFHLLDFSFRTCARGRNMTSLLDSTAHFEERCVKLGMVPAFVTALAGSHVDSLSKLAFVIGQPGQPIQNQEVSDFLQTALGRVPTLAETTALKRLGFEAHTYLVATLRQQIDQSDDTQPRKVAFAERTQRMDRLRQERWNPHMACWTSVVQFLTATT